MQSVESLIQQYTQSRNSQEVSLKLYLCSLLRDNRLTEEQIPGQFERLYYESKYSCDPDRVKMALQSLRAEGLLDADSSGIIRFTHLGKTFVAHQKLELFFKHTTFFKRRVALEKQWRNTRYKHWEVLLVLEEDLFVISKYIDIASPKNYSTHSYALSSLLMMCCTEIEKLCKRVSKKKDRIDFLQFFPNYYNEFSSQATTFPLWGNESQPWIKGADPDWWKAYNAVKHDRRDSQLAGNVRNVFEAFGGLYIVTLFYERFVYGIERMDCGLVILPPFITPKYITLSSQDTWQAYNKFGKQSEALHLTIGWRRK